MAEEEATEPTLSWSGAFGTDGPEGEVRGHSEKRECWFFFGGGEVKGCISRNIHGRGKGGRKPMLQSDLRHRRKGEREREREREVLTFLCRL